MFEHRTRKRRRSSALLAMPLLLLAGCPGECDPAPAARQAADAPQGAPAGAQFAEDFSTARGFYDRFVTQVHHRANDFSANVTWPGDHNMACEGPQTSRTVHGGNANELFWWCAPAGPDSGHVMTSMGNMSGYAIVSFAPNQVFPEVNKVCFDINMTLMDRKWFEVAVVPESTFQANRGSLAYVSPSAEAVDQTAMTTGNGFVVLEGTGAPGLSINRQKVIQGASEFGTTDKAKRYTHCFWDGGDGRVYLSQQRDGGTTVESAPGSFPNGPSRVIFKDHSYDAGKGGGASFGTWHWDNIVIS